MSILLAQHVKIVGVRFLAPPGSLSTAVRNALAAPALRPRPSHATVKAHQTRQGRVDGWQSRALDQDETDGISIRMECDRRGPWLRPAPPTGPCELAQAPVRGSFRRADGETAGGRFPNF